MNNTKTMKKIYIILFFALLSFVCMAIASKNSFLYAFNDCLDVNIFYVTVRGMATGRVLYKDIYDHKGPVLYFIYCLALFISKHSYVGIYIIESCLYTFYLFNIYRIAKIYIKNDYVNCCVTVIAGIGSCCGIAFYAGGQCEELVLSFLSTILYYALKYFHDEYPNRIPRKYVLIIGACSATVFWMKFSLLGMVVGLVLAITIIAIKDKKWKWLGSYIVSFLIGFLAITIPVLLYFVVNHGMESLFQVYFYDNIFKYSGIEFYSKKNILELIFSDSSFAIWKGPMLFTLGTIACILVCKNKMKLTERVVLALMLVGACLGITAAHVWKYSTEVLCLFGVVAILGIVFVIGDYGKIFLRTIRWLYGEYSSYMSDSKSSLKCMLYVSMVYALFEKTNMFVHFCAMVIALSLCKLLILATAKVKFGYFARYVLCAGTLYICEYEILKEILVCVLICMLLYDVGICLKWMVSNLQMKKTIRPMERVVITVFAVVVVCLLSVRILCVTVPYAGARELAIEEYPVYQMAECIRSSGVEQPIIINYDSLDNGLYWMLDLYPPDRRYAANNASDEEIVEMANKWIVSGKADFVLVSRFDIVDSFELEDYGYKRVYEKTVDYLNSGQTYYYSLYERAKE